MAVLVAGAAFLGAFAALPLLERDTTRIEHPTPNHPGPISPAPTRTSQIMTDDDTIVRKLAERYVKAVNTHDDATIAQLNCARAAPGLVQIAADGKPVTMTGLEPARGRDWYNLHLAIGGEPAGSRRIVKRAGDWCVED